MVTGCRLLVFLLTTINQQFFYPLGYKLFNNLGVWPQVPLI